MRIAVVGPAAAGKTTFARALNEQINLPVYHMDSILWQANWTKAPPQQAKQAHNTIVAQDRWLIEGWLDPNFRNRAERADLIIHLDYSAPTLVWRYLNRVRANENRREFAEGCVDTFSMRALATRILRWDNRKILKTLDGIDPKKIITFHAPEEASRFLNSHTPDFKTPRPA